MSKNKCFIEDCEITPIIKCVDCNNMVCIAHSRGTKCLDCTFKGLEFDEETREEIIKLLKENKEELMILKAEMQKGIEEINERIKKQQNRQFRKPEEIEIEELDEDELADLEEDEEDIEIDEELEEALEEALEEEEEE